MPFPILFKRSLVTLLPATLAHVPMDGGQGTIRGNIWRRSNRYGQEEGDPEGLACAQDIEGVDPEYYKNLTWLLEHDMTDVVDLNFVEEVDYFGRVEHVELKPGGRDIKVPASSKAGCLSGG